ncbi:MAG TPA: hypothetical protein VMT69_04340 [Kineosporiaceae bacterium]|nr:hypothetical protein [Kineosporiaceae bacterium]
MTNRLAALALTVLLVGGVVHTAAGTASESGARTWRFDLPSSARAAVQLDLAQVVPAARPVVERLAGMVAFDDDVAFCRPPAASCSQADSGIGGRWGIHLDRDTTAATFPSNRFLVYHELGHAVWGLLLTPDGHQAFVRAVGAALHGRPCINDLGGPCAVMPELFADEFARYAGGFAVSMSYYCTPPLLDPITFGALVGAPSDGTRGSVLAGLRATSLPDSIIGPVRFTAHGDIRSCAVSVYQIVGGTFRVPDVQSDLQGATLVPQRARCSPAAG